MVERFLLDGYKPQQLSTYALQLYTYETDLDGEHVIVDFWDTAGQEMFQAMHPSYYHQAHCCILVFDATRKITYKNLGNWLKELRETRPNIPVLCAVNKIDGKIRLSIRTILRIFLALIHFFLFCFSQYGSYAKIICFSTKT